MKRMRRLWMAFILPLISLGGLGLSLNLGAPAALAQYPQRQKRPPKALGHLAER